MNGPGDGPTRVVRGAALALICCALPLYGHAGARDVDRDSVIGVVVLLLAVIGIRAAARQLSFLRLMALLVAGQLAMHALLAVTIYRRVPGDVWTYQPQVARVDLVSGAQGAARLLASHLLFDLVVAAILYGCECNIWAWFRLAALRVLSPPPALAIPPMPDPPVLEAPEDTPALRPLFWVSASGRRGPPVSLTA